jgi:fido (protein-threonine AMPylation protein)
MARRPNTAGQPRRGQPHQPESLVGRPSRHSLYGRLEACLEHRLPSRLEAEGLWDDLWAAEAHNSTAIEGNTLALKQVEALLLQGRSVGGKELAEYLDVRGYADAARWVYSQGLDRGGWTGGELVTMTEVREVHRTALNLVWEVAPHPLAGPDESAGSFRRHDIRPFAKGMTPPGWTDVPAAVNDWVARVNAPIPSEQPRIERIAAAHAEFERIHPFLDGNGRAGRLLTNLILVRLGFPPAIIYKRDRRRYLNALWRADLGDVGPLGELLARAVLDNYYRLVVPVTAGPHTMVPLSALVTPEVTPRALRNAASRGRLTATRGSDGMWRSSRKAVDAYVASRYLRTDPAVASAREAVEEKANRLAPPPRSPGHGAGDGRGPDAAAIADVPIEPAPWRSSGEARVRPLHASCAKRSPWGVWKPPDEAEYLRGEREAWD